MTKSHHRLQGSAEAVVGVGVAGSVHLFYFGLLPRLAIAFIIVLQFANAVMAESSDAWPIKRLAARVIETLQPDGRLNQEEFYCAPVSSETKHCKDPLSGLEFTLSPRDGHESIHIPIILAINQGKSQPIGHGEIHIDGRSEFVSLRDDFTEMISSPEFAALDPCDFHELPKTGVGSDGLLLSVANPKLNSPLSFVFAGSEYHISGSVPESIAGGAGPIVGSILFVNFFGSHC